MHRQSVVDETTADQKTLALSQQLYNQGVADYFAVLEAEKALDAAEYELAGSDQDTAINLIALYKSLGGGWEMADHKLVDTRK
jgi:outer membrane protein TolC